MRAAMCAVVVVVALVAVPGMAYADLIDPVFTNTPTDSWAYYELSNAGYGLSSTYFPTTQAEFASASFVGYVTYDPAYLGPPSGPPYVAAGTGWKGNGDDSTHVFATYLTSTVDQTVSVRLVGDDGHSLFVDGAFAAGGGFGADVTYDLILSAGVQMSLQVVGHNGPGNWVFVFGVQGAQAQEITGPINEVSNLTLSATPIPEPGTLALLGLGLAGIALHRRRKSR